MVSVPRPPYLFISSALLFVSCKIVYARMMLFNNVLVELTEHAYHALSVKNGVCEVRYKQTRKKESQFN